MLAKKLYYQYCPLRPYPKPSLSMPGAPVVVTAEAVGEDERPLRAQLDRNLSSDAFFCVDTHSKGLFPFLLFSTLFISWRPNTRLLAEPKPCNSRDTLRFLRDPRIIHRDFFYHRDFVNLETNSPVKYLLYAITRQFRQTITGTGTKIESCKSSKLFN